MRQNGFEWLNRVECVDALAIKCIEECRGKFEEALKLILLQDYCLQPARMSKKQLSALKRDVKNRVQEIQSQQNSPGVGDVVLVPKQVAGLLPGVYQVHPRELISAEIIDIQRSGSYPKYTFRCPNGQLQKGNGHDIKKILQKAVQPPAVDHG